MDFIIRYCGAVGYLGLITINGTECYRTGKHHRTAAEALRAVEKWRADNGEEITNNP